MRRHSMLALLAGATTPLMPIFRASADEPKKLVVITWGAKTGDDMKTVWFDPFTKATGIPVEMRLQGGMMDMLATLRAQKNRMDADLWFTGMVPTILADQAELLQSIPLDHIPNAKNLPPAVVGDKYLGVFMTTYGLSYNTQKVPFKITKWDDIFDPRLKGRVDVPHVTGFAGKFLVLLSWLGGGNETHMDPGFAKLKQLVPNIGIVSKSDQEEVNFMTTGEADVAAFLPITDYNAIRAAGSQYAYVSPSPIGLSDYNNFALLKGPNTPAAIKFMNYALGPEQQTAYAARGGFLPVNLKSKVSPELKAYVPPRNEMRFADQAAISKGLQDWTDRWNQIVQR